MGRLKSEAGFTLMELLIVVAILGFTMAAVLGIYQVTQRSTFFATAGEDAQVVARAVLDRLTADFRLINAGRTTATGAIIEAPPSTATETKFTFLADYDNTLDSSGNLITVAAAAVAGDTSITVNNASTIFCGSTITISDGPVAESRALAPGTAADSNACKTAVGANTKLDFKTTPTPEKLATWYPTGSFVRSVETISYRWDSTSQKLCRSVDVQCPTTASSYTDSQLLAESVTKFTLTFLDSSNPPLPTATLNLIRAIKVEISVLSKSGDQTVTRTMQVTVRPRNFF